MKAKTAFMLGVFVSRAVSAAAWHVAQSETALGRECRRRLHAKRDHDQLLRLEEEVQEEIVRRSKANRKKEKKNGTHT